MPAAPMSRHPARRRYDRRGAAMLAVTLLGVAAAMLSILIVRQVIVASRATVFEQLSAEAGDLADQVVADTVAALQADPGLAFRRVMDGEAPRVCTVADPDDPDLLDANPDHPVYTAGQPWPAACGLVWDHQQAPVDPTLLKVIAPTVDADLQVQVLATAGKVQAGRQVVLHTPDAAAFAVWTDGNLSLDELADGPVTLDGLVYAARRMLLPSTPVAFGDVQLAAELGFVGTLDDTEGQRYYAAQPDPDADPPVRDIRPVVDVAGTAATLRSAVDTTATVGCPAATPVVVPTDTGDRASQLCLQPGADVLTVDGTAVTVPDAGAVLVLPGRSGAGTVDVHHRAEPVSRDTCRLRCDLYGLAAGDVAAGGHPGTLDGWEPIGTLLAPVSGVVGSPSLQTHVGLCGPAFVGQAAACETTAPSEPVTVVAGTADQAVDLIVGGPVTGVGLAATGDVALAWWATPAGGDLTLDVHVATPGTLAGLPDRRPAAATAGTLQLGGSLVVGHLRPVIGFGQVAVAPTGLAATPWLPGPDAGLVPAAVDELTAPQACGDRHCPTW